MCYLTIYMKKPIINYKRKPFSFYLSDQEKKIIVSKAKKFAGGNVSLWIREASTKHLPKV